MAENLDTILDFQQLSVRLQKSTSRKTLQNILKTAKSQLKNAFSNGIPARDLIQQFSQLIDYILIHIWRQFELPEKRLCLIAVGGYALEELHPYSDIDLLILTNNNYSQQSTAESLSVERFLTFLWDIGLEIGHNVSTISECIENIDQDITTYTNFLNRRLLIGDEQLFEILRDEIEPPHRMSHQAFFQAKLQEQKTRHEKYNHTVHQLEPDIKNGPGGLRDIHMITWFAKHYYGVTNLEALIPKGFITQSEYHTLQHAKNELLNIRFALHILTRKKEDRLLFDHQIALAKQFGHLEKIEPFVSDQAVANNIAVEHFMKHYFRMAKAVRGLNELLLQLLIEKVENSSEEKPCLINDHFQVVNHRLGLVTPDIMKIKPETLFELFLLFAQKSEIKGIQAETLRLIRHLCQQITTANNELCHNTSAHKFFLQLLKQKNDISSILTLMNRHELLGRYIPAFANIIGQMQYGLFHIYTVDQHTLFVIRNLCHFRDEKYKDKFPLCAETIKQIDKIELLFLAALFHDVGKRYNGDHSQLGKKMAGFFCENIGLTNEDREHVEWLVENHLLMSFTAQRKDIQDPDVIQHFADHVKNTSNLNYLYLLTVADICATNEKLWNGWKDSLLKQLFYATQSYLVSTQTTLNKTQTIHKKKKAIMSKLVAENINGERIELLWEAFDNSYFFLETEETIAWQTTEIIKHQERNKPLILIRTPLNKGCTEIFVYTQDKPNLFATTTAILDHFHLNIVEADILTARNGHTLDTYRVLDIFNRSIEDQALLNNIKIDLEKYHSVNGPTVRLKQRRISRHLRYFARDTTVTFMNDAEKNITELTIKTTDYRGLLARIGQAFAQCNIRLKKAKIITLGDQVEDIFYITDTNGLPLTDLQHQQQLRKSLYQSLEILVG